MLQPHACNGEGKQIQKKSRVISQVIQFNPLNPFINLYDIYSVFREVVNKNKRLYFIYLMGKQLTFPIGKPSANSADGKPKRNR